MQSQGKGNKKRQKSCNRDSSQCREKVMAMAMSNHTPDYLKLALDETENWDFHSITKFERSKISDITVLLPDVYIRRSYRT